MIVPEFVAVSAIKTCAYLPHEGIPGKMRTITEFTLTLVWELLMDPTAPKRLKSVPLDRSKTWREPYISCDICVRIDYRRRMTSIACAAAQII